MSDIFSTFQITVKVVSAEDRARLSSDADDRRHLETELLSHLRGFSSVVALLVAAKKPIVGHNCFMDLLKIYHQFVDNLPLSYDEFKLRVHRAFPRVYDTKHITYEVRRKLEGQDLYKLAGV